MDALGHHGCAAGAAPDEAVDPVRDREVGVPRRPHHQLVGDLRQQGERVEEPGPGVATLDAAMWLLGLMGPQPTDQ